MGLRHQGLALPDLLFQRPDLGRLGLGQQLREEVPRGLPGSTWRLPGEGPVAFQDYLRDSSQRVPAYFAGPAAARNCARRVGAPLPHPVGGAEIVMRRGRLLVKGCLTKTVGWAVS